MKRSGTAIVLDSATQQPGERESCCFDVEGDDMLSLSIKAGIATTRHKATRDVHGHIDSKLVRLWVGKLGVCRVAARVNKVGAVSQ